MKKVIEKEVQICDQCGKETYCHTCLHCGIEHCWECRKLHGVEYTHGVNFSGSGGGYYCNPCNFKLLAEGSDDLHNAYVLITNLRQEQKRWYSNFRAHSDKAESEVKRLSGT